VAPADGEEELPPDLLLGELAVAHRMVKPDHVRRCLALQRAQPPGARTALGQLLVEQDFLTLGQLNFLVRTQAATLAKQDVLVVEHPEDALFGKLAVHRGLVSPAQLAEAIREKADLARLKIHFRLGEILVKKGHLAAAQVQEILEIQRKRILECRACHARYNIAQFAPDAAFHCRLCGAVLEPVAEGDTSLAVKESLRRPSTGRLSAQPDEGERGPPA